jgi:hypothetical protein
MEGEGTRPHRWAVRMHKIADRLRNHQGILDKAPFLLVEMVKGNLDTHSPWVPYQTQIQIRRYLAHKHANNISKMPVFHMPFLELAGNGTLYFLRRLAPEAYKLVMGGTDEADEGDDDGKQTVVNNCTAAERSLWKGVLFLLEGHQSAMELHQHVNWLLGMDDLTWDDIEYTVCELRGFLYKPRPRKGHKSLAEWVAAMRAAHLKWYRKHALPVAWATMRHEGAQGVKRRRVS